MLVDMGRKKDSRKINENRKRAMGKRSTFGGTGLKKTARMQGPTQNGRWRADEAAEQIFRKYCNR